MNISSHYYIRFYFKPVVQSDTRYCFKPGNRPRCEDLRLEDVEGTISYNLYTNDMVTSVLIMRLYI